MFSLEPRVSLTHCPSPGSSTSKSCQSNIYQASPLRPSQKQTCILALCMDALGQHNIPYFVKKPPPNFACTIRHDMNLLGYRVSWGRFPVESTILYILQTVVHADNIWNVIGMSRKKRSPKRKSLNITGRTNLYSNNSYDASDVCVAALPELTIATSTLSHSLVRSTDESACNCRPQCLF